MSSASEAGVPRFDTGEIHLRPAVAADVPCLSLLAMQVFLDTYALGGIRPALVREVQSTFSMAAFDATLADAAQVLLVAEREGHLVGLAHVVMGTRHELAPSGAPAELLRLYVQEPFTGRGVGVRLLRAAEAAAAHRGATVLWLTPWVYNTRALGFYAHAGYADHGLTWFTIEGESHENRVLARSLAPPGPLTPP